MDLHVIGSKTESLASVATALKKVKTKERKPSQQTAFDIAQKMVRINAKDTEKVTKELENLKIARMTEEHIITIATLLPQSPDELKTVFAATKTTIKSEDLARILDVIPKL